MRKTLINLFLSIWFLSLNTGVSQTIKSQFTPMTPTLAQFIRYDECPITEYTGVPNISVPIYNIQVDGNILPITLTYHAGGIKVEQESSWVGLGWDLSLASIVQIINGEDDFKTSPTKWETLGFNSNRKKILPDWIESGASLYTGFGILSVPKDKLGIPSEFTRFVPYSNYPMPNVSRASTNHNYWLTFNNFFSVNGLAQKYDNIFNGLGYNNDDTEPDIFKVNLAGEILNIKMSFPQKSFHVLNKKGYKVDIDNQGKWIIIAPGGEEYHFEDYTESITSVLSRDYEKTDYCSARTWMLNRIITKNKQEINLSYTKKTKAYEVKNKSHSLEFARNTVASFYPKGSSAAFFTKGSYSLDERVDTTIITSRENQLYLTSITFPLGSIQFYTKERMDTHNTEQLNKIVVRNINKNNIKTFDFKYDHFPSKTGKSLRLKLVSILEDKEKEYSFVYNQTLLPDKTSFEQDYWGYYNGYTNNTSKLDNPSRFGYERKNGNLRYKEIYNNNLSANLVYSKAATLEKITFPTGGIQEFDYELNKFNNYWVPDADSINNKISKGFGLRIKSITYRDANKKLLKKERYEYENGKAIIPKAMILEFEQERYSMNSSLPGINYALELHAYTQEVIHLSSNGFYESNPLSSLNGVGYTKVIRQNIDENNKSTGRIETIYHNNPDRIPKQLSSKENVSTYVSLPAFIDTRYPNNGLPYIKRYFDKDSKLIEETIFKYKNVTSWDYNGMIDFNPEYGARISSHGGYFIKTGLTSMNPVTTNLTIQTSVIGLYPIIDQESLLIESEKKIISGRDTIRRIEKYNYDNHYNFLVNKTTYDYSYIDGIGRHHIYKYPYNFSDTISKQMVSRNILNIPIEEYFINYKGESYNFQRTKYNLTNSMILPQTVEYKNKDGQEYREKISYLGYDLYGNPLHIREDGTYNSIYLWSYSGQYLVAEIKNADLPAVEAAIKSVFGSNMTSNILSKLWVPNESSLRDGSLQKALPKALVTTYTYKPLVGMTSMTDPTGFTTYYTYDDFGRLSRTHIIENEKRNNIIYYQYHYKN